MSDPQIKATLKFPTESAVTTDETFTWSEVKALLDKEFQRRAEYVSRLLLAMKTRFGDEAMELARQTIYRIGYEKGQKRAEIARQNGEPISLENLASQVAHKISKLYFGTNWKIEDQSLVVRESYCPLPQKWKEMGFADGEIVELCMLFDQVDKGMAEGYDRDLVAELSGCWTLGEKGYCQMIIRKRGS